MPELDVVAGVCSYTGGFIAQEPPRGRRSFAEWVEASGPELGTRYVSELERNFRPYAPI